MNEGKSAQILSGFVLKLLAFLFMTLDHVGLFLITTQDPSSSAYRVGYVFRCAGRIAMPLFALFVAEGVRHSKKEWNYFFRLLAMHVGISLFLTIYFYAFPNPILGPYDVPGNAFADLSLWALTLILLRRKKWMKLLAILPIAFAGLCYGVSIYEHAQTMTVLWLPEYLRPSYSLLGLLICLGFYFAMPLTDLASKTFVQNLGISIEVYRETKSYRKMANIIGLSIFFAVTAIFWGISYLGYNYDYRPYDNYLMAIQTYSLLAVPLLFCYSGTRGYDSKTFRIATYAYYPVHIAILVLIFWL